MSSLFFTFACKKKSNLTRTGLWLKNTTWNSNCWTHWQRMREAWSPLTSQPMTSNEEIGYTWGDVFDRGKNIFKLRVALFCVCVFFLELLLQPLSRIHQIWWSNELVCGKKISSVKIKWFDYMNWWTKEKNVTWCWRNMHVLRVKEIDLRICR